MNAMTYEQLKTAVIEWARVRGILEKSDPKTQCLKFISEAGELADNIAKGDHAAAEDDLGDILVTLILLAELTNKDLLECLTSAYETIRNRSGKMIDGVFVKDIV